MYILLCQNVQLGSRTCDCGVDQRETTHYYGCKLRQMASMPVSDFYKSATWLHYCHMQWFIDGTIESDPVQQPAVYVKSISLPSPSFPASRHPRQRLPPLSLLPFTSNPLHLPTSTLPPSYRRRQYDIDHVAAL